MVVHRLCDRDLHQWTLFLYFRLFNTVDRKLMFYIKVCRCLDANYGPLESETTALPLYQLSHNHCPTFKSFVSFLPKYTIFVRQIRLLLQRDGEAESRSLPTKANRRSSLYRRLPLHQQRLFGRKIRSAWRDENYNQVRLDKPWPTYFILLQSSYDCSWDLWRLIMPDVRCYLTVGTVLKDAVM